jgi:hypothetical protein
MARRGDIQRLGGFTFEGRFLPSGRIAPNLSGIPRAVRQIPAENEKNGAVEGKLQEWLGHGTARIQSLHRIRTDST